MRGIERIRAVVATAAVLAALGGGAAHAVDGVIEINDASITAAGGYPYTIPASGSYVLTGNLTPPAGTGALVAGASDIAVDLNGFTITSPGGGTPIGIDAAGFGGLSVRGGAISGFDGSGISAGPGCKVIETTISANEVNLIGAMNCLVVMNQIVGATSGSGVVAVNSKIENNVIAGNAAAGISGSANVIVHNEIAGNAGGGILDLGANKIQENVIISNLMAGITDGSPPGPPPPVPPPAGAGRTNIIGNIIDNNFGGPGIRSELPLLITDNTITNNFANGIFCGAACVVRGNVVDRNNLSVTPGSGGVSVSSGSTVHANAISFNDGFGLMLPLTSGYTNNTISGNGSPLGAGPDVVSPGATVTGAFGNNCSAAPCP